MVKKQIVISVLSALLALFSLSAWGSHTEEEGNEQGNPPPAEKITDKKLMEYLQTITQNKPGKASGVIITRTKPGRVMPTVRPVPKKATFDYAVTKTKLFSHIPFKAGKVEVNAAAENLMADRLWQGYCEDLNHPGIWKDSIARVKNPNGDYKEATVSTARFNSNNAFDITNLDSDFDQLIKGLSKPYFTSDKASFKRDKNGHFDYANPKGQRIEMRSLVLDQQPAMLMRVETTQTKPKRSVEDVMCIYTVAKTI